MGPEDLAVVRGGSKQSGEALLRPGTGVRKEEREVTPGTVWSLAQAEILPSAFPTTLWEMKKKKSIRKR